MGKSGSSLELQCYKANASSEVGAGPVPEALRSGPAVTGPSVWMSGLLGPQHSSWHPCPLPLVSAQPFSRACCACSLLSK